MPRRRRGRRRWHRRSERWHEGVPLLLQVGDVGGYRRRRSQELRRFANTTDARTAHVVSKDSLIIPIEDQELKVASALADRALASDPRNPWHLLGNGIAEYRLGHYEQAIAWLAKITDRQQIFLDVERELFLAMSNYRAGKQPDAREVLARGMRVTETRLPVPGEGELGNERWNRLESIRGRSLHAQDVWKESTAFATFLQEIAQLREHDVGQDQDGTSCRRLAEDIPRRRRKPRGGGHVPIQRVRIDDVLGRACH